ncbi:hypothetical protein M5D96_007278 [Drosophila gunungcola]|uniref:Uncharacterized protein n=1 Tax=Drosophila gunungcola TaxID=103775 RepID=A0A9P9YN97_9MUSC|nr:hypothetical protein M5D96_007278 [Drosophila gunungcola]
MSFGNHLSLVSLFRSRQHVTPVSGFGDLVKVTQNLETKPGTHFQRRVRISISN